MPLFLHAQIDVVLPEARKVLVRTFHEQEQASKADIALSVSHLSLFEWKTPC